MSSNNSASYDDKKQCVSRAQARKMREDFIREAVNNKLSLYIKNFDEIIDEQWFKSNFEQFGTITCVKLLTENGKHKGVAFVTFSTKEAASNAKEAMHGYRIGNRPLYISFAERKEDKAHYQDAQTVHHNVVVPPTPAPQNMALMTPVLTEKKDLYYQHYAHGMSYFYRAEDIMSHDMMQAQASQVMMPPESHSQFLGLPHVPAEMPHEYQYQVPHQMPQYQIPPNVQYQHIQYQMLPHQMPSEMMPPHNVNGK